jgi:hypothetical protein
LFIGGESVTNIGGGVGLIMSNVDGQYAVFEVCLNYFFDFLLLEYNDFKHLFTEYSWRILLL